MAQRAAQDDAIQRFIKTKQPLDGGPHLTSPPISMGRRYISCPIITLPTGQELTVDGGWGVTEE